MGSFTRTIQPVQVFQRSLIVELVHLSIVLKVTIKKILLLQFTT